MEPARLVVVPQCREHRLHPKLVGENGLIETIARQAGVGPIGGDAHLSILSVHSFSG